MKFGQLTNSRKRTTARKIASVKRVSPHVRMGGEPLTKEEIIRIRAELIREKEEWQKDLNHKTRNRLAVKKLLRNTVKQQILQICTLLRNQLRGKKPDVYQVLGFFVHAKGRIHGDELRFAANVMNIETKAGRAVWSGNPGFILPLLQERETPRGRMTWLELIDQVMSEQIKPIATLELSQKAGLKSEPNGEGRTNAAMQLLQAIRKVERLPDKIVENKPTAMWQASGRPVRVDYPNVFMDVLNRIPLGTNEWVKLTQLHSPKKTSRGEKKAPTVGNLEAQFTSTAVRSVIDVLKKSGIVKLREDKMHFDSPQAKNMEVYQYAIQFTPVGKRLWENVKRTGILPPRLAQLFTSRNAE